MYIWKRMTSSYKICAGKAHLDANPGTAPAAAGVKFHLGGCAKVF